MEPLTGLAVVSGAGILFALLRWGSREKQRTWRRAAKAAGVLVHGDERAWFFQGLTGQVEADRSLTIRITPVNYGTHITVSGLAGVEALHLASAGLTERVFGQHDPRIGDDAFDAAVVIGGPVALAQATLDSHTRAALLRLFRGAISFDVGRKAVNIVAQGALTHGRLELSLMKDLDGDAGERLEAVLR
ncbi:MAG TPA: hypothetical protein VFF36_07145, partial [Planctomycetota bacterium]|nr:hypothetical protein [Planctomycetota bacterium]